MSMNVDPADSLCASLRCPRRGQRALCRSWEQVKQEEWIPQSRHRPARVSLGERDARRGRRAARRSLGLVTRSGQVRAGAAGEAA
jgi:hypothetical protein